MPNYATTPQYLGQHYGVVTMFNVCVVLPGRNIVDLFAELGAVEVVRDAVTPPMLRKIKR